MAFSNQTKNTSSFGNQSKNTSTIDDGVDFLLKEDEFFLLLETGGKIVLNQSTNAKEHSTYTNQTKH